jgi:hypothetical protein
VADLKGAFGRREEQLLRDRDKAASSFERVEAHLKQCDDAFRRQLAAKTNECTPHIRQEQSVPTLSRKHLGTVVDQALASAALYCEPKSTALPQENFYQCTGQIWSGTDRCSAIGPNGVSEAGMSPLLPAVYPRANLVTATTTHTITSGQRGKQPTTKNIFRATPSVSSVLRLLSVERAMSRCIGSPAAQQPSSPAAQQPSS